MQFSFFTVSEHIYIRSEGFLSASGVKSYFLCVIHIFIPFPYSFTTQAWTSRWEERERWNKKINEKRHKVASLQKKHQILVSLFLQYFIMDGFGLALAFLFLLIAQELHSNRRTGFLAFWLSRTRRMQY